MRSVSAMLLLGLWLSLACDVAVAEGVIESEPSSAAPLATTPARPAEEAKIDGFRSAQFGMNEAQIRQAIRKDFPAAGEKITSELNPAEKTTVLSVQIQDLIPGSGRAKASYIIGYSSKKLIQVNVTWATDPKVPASAEGVVATANLLRTYFLGSTYKADSVIANRQLPNGYLVFRGADARSRMVVVLLTGATAVPEGEKAPPVALQLSYIGDPDHPDIYQVPKGAF